MKNIFKLLSLVLVLSVTAVACGDKKECAADCKKECCEKKDAAPAADAESATMDESTDDTTEVQGDEQAHVCTPACEADPHSCPNHDHEHDH